MSAQPSQQASEADNIEDETAKKGVKTKLLGVGLIFLGAMDSMLFWRGGLVVSDFYLLLFVLGCVIYIIGTIRSRGSGCHHDRDSSSQVDLKR